MINLFSEYTKKADYNKHYNKCTHKSVQVKRIEIIFAQINNVGAVVLPRDRRARAG